MIKLKEILNKLQQEDTDLTPVDNWKITDYDFMTDMDFKPDGQYSFSLKKPHIKVYHKRGTGFIVEDFSKTNSKEVNEKPSVYNKPQEDGKNKPEKKIFPTFTELTEYFTKYEQKFENTPYENQ